MQLKNKYIYSRFKDTQFNDFLKFTTNFNPNKIENSVITLAGKIKRTTTKRFLLALFSPMKDN